MSVRYVGIYRPVSGWKAVLYDENGPVYTGSPCASPYGALTEAREIAETEGCELHEPVIELCPICNDWKVSNECECSREERHKVWQKMLDDRRAREAN